MRIITVAAMFVMLGLSQAWAQDKPVPSTDKEILGPHSYWRYFYTVIPAVVKKDGNVQKLEIKAPKVFYGGSGSEVGQWLAFDTPMPPANWMEASFNDVDWHRKPVVDPDACWIGHVAMRSRFSVDDPAQVKGLKLNLKYRGGVVVYLNGKELARGNVKPGAGPKDLADDYPDDQIKQVREIKDLAIPAALLKKGVNVIALDVFRSAIPDALLSSKEAGAKSSACGVSDAFLTALKDDPVAVNEYRPAGFQVWNSSIMAQDLESDHGDPTETLKPIHIVAPRAGAGSGKVVVGSRTPIKGLKASISDLSEKGGPGKIPLSALRVRYGLRTQNSAAELTGPRSYPVHCVDALDDTPPDTIAIMTPNLGARNYREREMMGGAVASIWVTVEVPADAKPGDYSGSLTVSVPDTAPVVVPVELVVSPWKSIDPKSYTTFVEVVESPESLSIGYDVPMWSDAHFKLIGKAMSLLGEVGNATCYIPLICDTNMGNDETMVRWIKQPDGSFKYDLTVMRKYLDSVEKFQGKPRVVCLYVWDSYLEGGLSAGEVQEMSLPGHGQHGQDVLAGRREHEGKGPLVSLLDPATQKVEKFALPVMYTDNEASSKLWGPLMQEVRDELKKRGLEKTAMLGIITDVRPTKEVVTLFKKIAPGLPWVCHAHERFQEQIHDADLGYISVVAAWGQSQFLIDPTVERPYGWHNAALKTHNARYIHDSFNPTTWKFLGEMNVEGRQRGFSRVGGDFLPVLKNAKGQIVGSLSARFPKTAWRMLNIITSTLARGEAGPVPTVRFEVMREGLQETEARIYIEKALVDEKLRAKLGPDLAKKCQDFLDSRTRDMFRAVSTLRGGCQNPASWWNTPPVLGSQWYIASGWQNESLKLYQTACEVQKKLEGQN